MAKETPRSRRRSAKEQSDVEAHADLVDRLVALVDRTFADAGHGQGIRMVREMFLRLDRPALRELVRSMGIEAAEELSEPEPEDRSGRSG
jgi:hypothetical protein